MNVDGDDSDSEINEAMSDTPPDIAEEASAAKQDLKESKNPETTGSMRGVWQRKFRSAWGERVQKKENDGEI
jgi:hypothetical protein